MMTDSGEHSPTVVHNMRSGTDFTRNVVTGKRFQLLLKRATVPPCVSSMWEAETGNGSCCQLARVNHQSSGITQHPSQLPQLGREPRTTLRHSITASWLRKCCSIPLGQKLFYPHRLVWMGVNVGRQLEGVNQPPRTVLASHLLDYIWLECDVKE